MRESILRLDTCASGSEETRTSILQNLAREWMSRILEYFAGSLFLDKASAVLG